MAASSADATAFLSQVLPDAVASPVEQQAPPPGLARQSSGNVGDGEG
eukprot:COSAG06_NODE_59439_length_274_cov_0.594286_1_plen_46_part_01